MLSRNLEQTLHRALAHAIERSHEYATGRNICYPSPTIKMGSPL